MDPNTEELSVEKATEIIPAGEVKAEVLPAENVQAEVLPAENVQAEVLPAENTQTEVLPENVVKPGNSTELVAKKPKKTGMFIGIGVAVLIVAVAVVVIITVGKDGRKYRSDIRVAEKYINELDYESAIASYKAAIAIDPTAVDAYLGLIDVYCKMAEDAKNNEEYETAMTYYDLALSVAQDGISNTNNSEAFDSVKSDIESKSKEIASIIARIEEEKAEAELQKKIKTAISDMKSDEITGWCYSLNDIYKLISKPEEAADGSNIYYFIPENGIMAKGLTEVDGVKYKFNKENGIYKGKVPNVRLEEVNLDFLDGIDYDNLVSNGNNIAVICSPKSTDANYYDLDTCCHRIIGYDFDGNYQGEVKLPFWTAPNKEYRIVATCYSYTITEDYLFFIIGDNVDGIEHLFVHAYQTDDYAETDTYLITDENIVNDYFYSDVNMYSLYVRDVNGKYEMYYAKSGSTYMSFMMDENGKFVILGNNDVNNNPTFDGYIVSNYYAEQDCYFIYTADYSEWGYGRPDGTVICTFMDASDFTNSGYALVSNDGQTYDLIDSDFDVIAENVVQGRGAGSDGYIFNVTGIDGEEIYYRIIED